MRNVSPLLLVLVCSLANPVLPTAVAQNSQAVADLSLQQGAAPKSLMLRNGSVFSGIIRQHEGRYVVKLDARTQMSFDPLQVWAVADDVSDLYEYRRTRIKADDVVARVGLVRWCVAQKLIPQAEEELRTLRARQVPAEQLRSLELLLANARLPSDPPGADRTTVAGNASRPIPTLPSLSSHPSRQTRPPADARRGSPAVAAATTPGLLPAVGSAQVADARKPSPQAAKPLKDSSLAANSPLTQALAPRPAASRGLASPEVGPPSLLQPSLAEKRPQPVVNSVFSFYDQPGFRNDSPVQAVAENRVPPDGGNELSQPVHWTLVQACAGCHYPENQRLQRVASFVLEIPSGQHKATVDQTRHNIEQLMTLIDRNQPANSRLLELLERPHGPLTEPPLDPASPDLVAVREWIHRAGQREAPSDSATRVVTASAEMATGATGAAGATVAADREPWGQPLLPAAAIKPSVVGPSSEEAHLGNGLGNGSSLGSGWGPEIDPRRPYDPEPFNRRYHPQRPSRAVDSPMNPPLGKSGLTPREEVGRPIPAVLVPTGVPEFSPPAGLPRIRRAPSNGSPNQDLVPSANGGR